MLHVGLDLSRTRLDVHAINKADAPVVTIQVAAGIQTFPLVSSVRTSKGRRPCLVAVDRWERIAAKFWAPARVRRHPGTFCLILTIRMSRSARCCRRAPGGRWRTAGSPRG